MGFKCRCGETLTASTEWEKSILFPGFEQRIEICSNQHTVTVLRYITYKNLEKEVYHIGL